MVQIDHTTPLTPEPARPILASHLLVLEENQRKRFSGRGDRIKTGCGEIDDYMLGGGCERGIVMGISAEEGEGRLISLNLLASILLSYLPLSATSSIDPSHPPKTKATIVDTSGSFPLSLLANVLKSRISTSKSVASNQRQAGEDGGDVEDVTQLVHECLKMVAISRVFDVEGLWEVLGEVGRASAANDQPVAPLNNPATTDNVENKVGKAIETSDSDEEALVIEGNEGTATKDFSATEVDTGTTGVGRLRTTEQEHEGMEIIIVDNMTHIINELFARKEKSEAHDLLTTLSRTIHTLTHQNNILTILHNSTISTTHPYPSTRNPLYSTSRKNPQHPQPPSLFPSNPHKPALGQIFSQFPDLHLLMTHLPKGRADAEIFYRQDAGQGYVDHCCVVEVLKDETPNRGGREATHRFAAREQRWAAVDVRADGLGLVNAFTERGGVGGLGLAGGGVRDVGDVAKIYGFGGRKV